MNLRSQNNSLIHGTFLKKAAFFSICFCPQLIFLFYEVNAFLFLASWAYDSKFKEKSERVRNILDETHYYKIYYNNLNIYYKIHYGGFSF